MTTIACDGRSIAADRKVTHGSQLYHSKKIFVVGDSIVGLAGDSASCNRWLAWFRAGQPPDGPSFTEDDGVDVLVLNRSGLYLYTECSPPDKLIDKAYAVGTGGQAALTLMRVIGCGAFDAVSEVHRIDPNTGPKVDVLYLSDVPKGGL